MSLPGAAEATVQLIQLEMQQFLQKLTKHFSLFKHVMSKIDFNEF